MLRINTIRTKDVSNGPGLRVSVFVQGCNRRCKNCFNPETWDYNGGHELNYKIQAKLFEAAKNSNITGISILGGEPLDQPDDLLVFLKDFINEVPNKTIWIWTGYKFEELTDIRKTVACMADVLVDGAFIDELKNPDLQFRGSLNQRIINIHKTLSTGAIQLWT